MCPDVFAIFGPQPRERCCCALALFLNLVQPIGFEDHQLISPSILLHSLRTSPGVRLTSFRSSARDTPSPGPRPPCRELLGASYLSERRTFSAALLICAFSDILCSSVSARAFSRGRSAFYCLFTTQSFRQRSFARSLRVGQQFARPWAVDVLCSCFCFLWRSPFP